MITASTMALILMAALLIFPSWVYLTFVVYWAKDMANKFKKKGHNEYEGRITRKDV